jgi:hypothetical protein
MTHNPFDSPPVDNNPKLLSSRRFLGAAVVLVLIVVLGLTLTLTNLFGGHTDKPSAAPPSSTQVAHTGGDASLCGLDQVQLTGTVISAPKATWSLVGTIAAPSIKGQGPGRVDDDGYRNCFARTPTGALLAAANLAALGSDRAIAKKFNDLSLVPGPGRDVLLRKPVTGESDSSVRIQIAGFRVLRYTGDQADIDIAIRTSRGAVGADVINLAWSGGDWKWRVADDGNPLNQPAQLPNLAGYIPWSGA